MNFCGSELFSLDEKNRLVIPAKMARNIPSYAERTFYVTRGLDGSIYGYTKDV
jgi:DNA-binding transcriptional regulator/RsmH inhibitor MraZ